MELARAIVRMRRGGRSRSCPTTASTTSSSGVVHAVIARIAPEARVIDITHGIPRHDVRSGRAHARAGAAVHAARRAPRGRRSGGRRAAPRGRAADRRGGPAARRAGQRAAVARGRAVRRHRRGGRDLGVAAAAASRSRRRSTAATSSRRSPRALAAGAPLADAGTRWSPSSSPARHAPPRRAAERSSPTCSASTASATSCSTPSTTSCRAGLRLGHRVGQRGDGASTRTYARTFADVPPGDAAALRGRRTARWRSRSNRGSAAARARRARCDEVRSRAHAARGMTGALGRPRLHLRATASTNDRARALAAAGAPHGTLVTAGAQRAGRGRQGRDVDRAARPGAAHARWCCATRPAAAAPRRPRRRRPGRRGPR